MWYCFLQSSLFFFNRSPQDKRILLVNCQNKSLSQSFENLLDEPAYGIIQVCFLSLSSVHSLRRVRLFATPWIVARQTSLSITNSRSLPKLISTESVMASSHLILCLFCINLLVWPHYFIYMIPLTFLKIIQNEAHVCLCVNFMELFSVIYRNSMIL